jgi:hypothetical protein
VFRRKPDDDAWEGTVIEKSRGMLDGSNMYHFLTVEKIGADVDRIRVSRRLWKAASEGDAMVKRPGAHPELAPA